jgi:hypothetical protein
MTPLKQWLLIGLLVAVTAAASGVTVYLLTGNDRSAAPISTPQPGAVHPLSDLVPSPVWQTCKQQDTPRPGAIATAACIPPANSTTFTPDRLEISSFPSGAAVQRAYESERRSHRVPHNRGRCNGLSWGGEGTWLHNPSAPGSSPKPGGSRFCYFAGNNVVIVWTYRKFGQATHTDILGIAREGGSDHPGLYGWWRFWHHRIGKVIARARPVPGRGAGCDSRRRGGWATCRGRGAVLVGRGGDAGLVIEDPEISRAHAVLASTGEGLEDRGPRIAQRNLGERRTHHRRDALAPGDVIKVGTTRVEVLSVSVAPSAGAQAPLQRASPTPVAAEDELRPVSALFADIVGSTALAERLAPEDFTALIGGCVDRMCRAVEQFGGVIDAYMGDGIAAFFGFPTANEHDATGPPEQP